MQKKLGDKIIIGEEITTTDGEIIGLFLEETIPAGLTAVETVKQIRLQGGLVYIPHPFETFRKGIQLSVLESIKEEVAIVEVFNGRGVLRGKARQAAAFVNLHKKSAAASSDAHGVQGMGYTYSLVNTFPLKASLIESLVAPSLSKQYAPFYTLFYPFINRIKNKIILTNG